MNKPQCSIASDYAVLSTKNASFYFGYEKTIGDEWCFEAKFNGVIITIPFSRLKAKDMFDVVDCLMVGIGWILAKYELVNPLTKKEEE